MGQDDFQRFYALVQDGHVVVKNFRPGVATQEFWIVPMNN